MASPEAGMDRSVYRFSFMRRAMRSSLPTKASPERPGEAPSA